MTSGLFFALFHFPVVADNKNTSSSLLPFFSSQAEGYDLPAPYRDFLKRFPRSLRKTCAPACRNLRLPQTTGRDMEDVRCQATTAERKHVTGR